MNDILSQRMHILLVDDNPTNLKVLFEAIGGYGWKALMATDCESAFEQAEYAKPDLILLDIMMPPGIDGFETCRRLKANPITENIPVIFMTALSDANDKVKGLEIGAVDYITKPIKPKVLVSKVKALLRRLKEDKVEVEDIVKVGNIVINREEYKIVNDGKELILPRKEFELLSLLTSKPSKVFKREVILDKVWGNEVVVGGRTIDVHIRKLREKIGDHHFKTVKGVGYKFVL